MGLKEKEAGKRKRKGKESIEYLPTLQECFSSPKRLQKIVKDSIVKADAKLVSTDIFDVPGSDSQEKDQIIDRQRVHKKDKVNTEEPAIPNHIPDGTPVLASWRRHYYPALVILYSEEKDTYRIRYYDNIERWLKRKDICTTSDPTFRNVPVPDTEELYEILDTSMQTSLDTDVLAGIIEKYWSKVKSLFDGTESCPRSVKFFSNHLDRAHLHYDVKTGPFTFQEYYKLSDILKSRLEIELLQQQQQQQSEDHFMITVRERFQDEDGSSALLIQQFLTMVILPEITLEHVKELYPNEQVEAKLYELSNAKDKDYVHYLLAHRDIAKWGTNKK